MLKISRQVDYALQLIVTLSKLSQNEVLSLSLFAKQSNISFFFLQKIVRLLRHAGIVQAIKGKHGGYRLIRDPKELNIRAIMEAVDGTTGISTCTREEHCTKAGICDLEKGIRQMHADLSLYLEKTTVADIA